MYEMKISEGGRVVIPAPIRRSLDLNEGDTVVWDILNGEVHLSTRKKQLENRKTKTNKNTKYTKTKKKKKKNQRKKKTKKKKKKKTPQNHANTSHGAHRQ